MRIAETVHTTLQISRSRPLLLSFAVSGAIQLMNVATGTILARHLGPGSRGELAAVILWPTMLAALGSLGVAEALTYHLARASHPPGRLIRSGLGLCLIQSLVLVTIGFLVVPRVLAGYGPRIISLTCLYLLFVPLNLTTMCLMAALNGLRRYARYQWLRLFNIGVTVLGIAYLALTGQLTVRSVTLVYLLAWSLSAASAVQLLRLRFNSVRADRVPYGQLLSFGLKSHSGSISFVLNESLDKLLMSIVLAPANLGLYVVAVTLTSVTSLVGSSAAGVTLPLIASMENDHGRGEKARHLVTVTLVVSIVVTIPFIVFLPVVVDIAFGPRFAGSVGPGRILLVATIFQSVNRVLTTVLRAIGRPLDAGIGESIALAVTVIGLVVLLGRLALAGAAVTSLAAYLVSMIWMIRRAGRVLHLPAMAILVPDRDMILLLWRACQALGITRGRARRV
jgi:O-antigen/teichoic acid export membrane protein